MNGLPAGKSRTDLLGNLLNGWVQNDPDAATKFAQDLPPGAERNKVMQNVIGQLASGRTRREAVKLAALLLPASALGNYAYQIANSLSQQDPQAAMDWIKIAAPRARRKQNALQNASWQLAQNDPKSRGGGFCRDAGAPGSRVPTISSAISPANGRSRM